MLINEEIIITGKGFKKSMMVDNETGHLEGCGEADWISFEFGSYDIYVCKNCENVWLYNPSTKLYYNLTT